MAFLQFRGGAVMVDYSSARRYGQARADGWLRLCRSGHVHRHPAIVASSLLIPFIRLQKDFSPHALPAAAGQIGIGGQSVASVEISARFRRRMKGISSDEVTMAEA